MQDEGAGPGSPSPSAQPHRWGVVGLDKVDQLFMRTRAYRERSHAHPKSGCRTKALAPQRSASQISLRRKKGGVKGAL